MIAGVTLPTQTHLSPVSAEELYDYCYETLKSLDILSLSAEGTEGVDVWVEGTVWNGSPEQKALVERSALWKSLKSALDYAEGGRLTLTEGQIDDLLVELAQWLCATFAHREFNGCGIWAGEKIIYKFIARMKLDHEWDVSEMFGPIESGWYPHAHSKHLTIFEMALLAGMENIRSVRNATYDDTDRLKTIKEGRNVLVVVADARRWLQGKKGFVPTKGVDYDNAN